jgi:hypothetical protein
MTKRTLLAIALMSGMSSMALGQATVTFDSVDFDADSADTGGSVFAADFSKSESVYLACGNGGAEIFYINEGTGVQTDVATDGTLDITGITISGLGFFAVAVDEAGKIYAVQVDTGEMWTWDSTTSSPVQGATSVGFARTGEVVGTGANAAVYWTGSADAGPTEVWTTTDGTNFTLAETIAGADAESKSALAVSPSEDQLWAVPDVGSPIAKAVKSGGTWAQETTTWSPTDGAASGPLEFDSVNNVVFGIPMTGSADTVYALDADTGDTLGSTTVSTALFTTAGYCGDALESSFDSVSGTGSGTLWTAARGTSNDVIMHKFSYSVTFPSDVNDWSVY